MEIRDQLYDGHLTQDVERLRGFRLGVRLFPVNGRAIANRPWPICALLKNPISGKPEIGGRRPVYCRLGPFILRGPRKKERGHLRVGLNS